MDIENMWKYLDHVMQSIVLFDQKAAALVAICVGMLYVLIEMSKLDRFQTRRLRLVTAGGMVSVVVSLAVALTAIFPSAGFADRRVKEGPHLLPHDAAHIVFEDSYDRWFTEPTAQQQHHELLALIKSRVLIRQYKFRRIQAATAILLFSVAFTLLLAGRDILLSLSEWVAVYRRRPRTTAHGEGTHSIGLPDVSEENPKGGIHSGESLHNAP